MSTSTSTFKTPTDRRTVSDTGQAALVLVIAFTVLLTLFGGVMVNSIVNNAPILTQASIQRYAYRALASGVNAYQNAINADPYLAACNSSTNNIGQCAGLSYQDWSTVPGTDVGNGVIPEYYKFDNPQQVMDSNNAITNLEVQIVGAAGFPGNLVYYSTVARFTPQNGFLNAVWWSNYESSDFPTGHAADCNYFYTPNRTSGSGSCNMVVFQSGDALYGPIYSNDSLDITGSPTFSGTVNTADPDCLFVNDGTGAIDSTSSPSCTGLDAGNYTVAGSKFNHVNEPIPTDNSQLAATAKLGGCYYEGPTTIALSVTAGGVGQVSVVSKQTANTGGVDNMNLGVNTSTCRTDGTKTALPNNGVLYVNASSCSASGSPPPKCVAGANPFDPNTNNASQIQSNCPNCYYGQSGTPDTEGDAFISNATSSGGLSGQLTVAASNDVIIDGPLTYHDCTWGPGGTGTPSQSVCQYNNAVTGTNDTLGLIANNYVEVNRPVDNTTLGARGGPTTLPACGSGGALPAPLCDPSTATGSPTGGQGLTIDATILGLSQSYVVNNYSAPGSEGQLTVYGSIQQNARGPVGLVGGTGYVKHYQWDPRLTLYGPPFYLTPGTPSWALDSSSESYTGKCPYQPAVQTVPSTSQPTWPVLPSPAVSPTNVCAVP
jgi:hypothetical protein